MACTTPDGNWSPVNGADLRSVSSPVSHGINSSSPPSCSSTAALRKNIDPHGYSHGSHSNNGRQHITVESHQRPAKYYRFKRPDSCTSCCSNSKERSGSGSNTLESPLGYPASLEHRIDRGWEVKDDNTKERHTQERRIRGNKIIVDPGTPSDDMNLSFRSSHVSSPGAREDGSCATRDKSCPRSTESALNPEGTAWENHVRVRPITAIPSSLKAKRYLESRLRDMYKQRRAASSLPQARSIVSGVTLLSSRRPRTGSVLRHSKVEDGRQMELTPLVKFRLVGRVTMCLLHLMKSIIKNSQDKTNRSADELQWFTLYGQSKADQLAFNKDIYSRNRIMTHIPDWALSILELEPEDRTEEHCRLLHALLRGLKSFDKFTEQIQMSMCRAFRLEKLSEGRVVLKQNHIGMYFYFIYSGSVFVNTTDQAADGTPFTRTVAVLHRGDSFGELALLKDIRRTASVSIREKCELLVVDKDVFARVCPKIFERELEEKHQFIGKLSLFPSKWWSNDKQRALSMQAQIQEFKINKVVVPDSALEDWIYACMEGKCQVIQSLSLTRTPKDPSLERKHSDVVLSEEIIELLSSAAAVSKSQEVDGPDENMKENLLSSLGLDYVTTGKHRGPLYENDRNKARLRAMQGLDEATTLSAFMKKNAETKKDDIYLKVGVIEPGDIFDVLSLVKNDKGEYNPRASSLLLVSGGAKILKIRKSAFFAHASQQAIEHTKTLASKQRYYSDDFLIKSYKEKKIWAKFKSGVVNEVIQHRIAKSEHVNLMRGIMRPSSTRPRSTRPKTVSVIRRPISQRSVLRDVDRKSDCDTASCSEPSTSTDADDRSFSLSPSVPSSVFEDEFKFSGITLLTDDDAGDDQSEVKKSFSDSRATKKKEIFVGRRNSSVIVAVTPKSKPVNKVTRRPHTAYPVTRW